MGAEMWLLEEMDDSCWELQKKCTSSSFSVDDMSRIPIYLIHSFVQLHLLFVNSLSAIFVNALLLRVCNKDDYATISCPINGAEPSQSK